MINIIRTPILSTLLLLCFAFISNAQTDWGIPIDESTKKVQYTDVIEVSGTNKDVLFERAIEWINDYYTAGYKKIKTKDKESGVILIKDRMHLYKIQKKTKVNDALIDYKIEFNFKDEKLKYKIYDFYHFQHSLSNPIEEWMDPGSPTEKLAPERYQQINANIEQLIESFKTSMKKSGKNEVDNW